MLKANQMKIAELQNGKLKNLKTSLDKRNSLIKERKGNIRGH